MALKCTQYEEVEIDSFDGVEDGLDDVTEVGQNVEENHANDEHHDAGD